MDGGGDIAAATLLPRSHTFTPHPLYPCHGAVLQRCSSPRRAHHISIPTRDPKVFYNDVHHPGGLTGARAMGDMASALILNAAISLVEEPFSAADASGLEVGSTCQSRPTYKPMRSRRSVDSFGSAPYLPWASHRCHQPS